MYDLRVTPAVSRTVLARPSETGASQRPGVYRPWFVGQKLAKGTLKEIHFYKLPLFTPKWLFVGLSQNPYSLHSRRDNPREHHSAARSDSISRPFGGRSLA